MTRSSLGAYHILVQDNWGSVHSSAVLFRHLIHFNPPTLFRFLFTRAFALLLHIDMAVTHRIVQHKLAGDEILEDLGG